MALQGFARVCRRKQPEKTVNRLVDGSNPSRGASFFKHLGERREIEYRGAALVVVRPPALTASTRQLPRGVASPPPALRERRHRLLAGGRIAVPRLLDVAVAVVAAGPHPRATRRCGCVEMEDAARDDAVLKHVVIVIAPLPGGTR